MLFSKIPAVSGSYVIPDMAIELGEMIRHFQMQGGEVYAMKTETQEYAAFIGIMKSHIEGILEIGMMHTVANSEDLTLNDRFLEHILSEENAQALRCQLTDESSCGLVEGLGFSHESTIFGSDLLEQDTDESLISVAGKAFDYLTPDQITQLRALVVDGAKEESEYTGQPYHTPDEQLDQLIERIRNAQDDVFVKVVDEQLIAALAIDPNAQYPIISTVLVHPEHRLQGIGRALINKAVKEYAREDTLVLAVVLEATPHLKEFFTNSGLIPVARIYRYLRLEGVEGESA
ncbi:putative GCN5-related N-acetyltransferase [Erwinia phage vB_EamM_Phobos]|uniref:putative GCN5-related N-acetyltransferase n=1 Tax=Erwinia phage vB_EamM_Phobos TaxID=1883377 RepID=UPI00081CD4FB|nr:putative GCN5-related N-acetyltransferase [Erwinia phage vB_EamM_Phobos]ANZ50293.1 putative GCN5-related N-acetyltransferase [Erwinia phage vB_EamM_Phobos]